MNYPHLVRYDHDLESEMGHDVTKEGLHMDVYRDGEKVNTVYVTRPLPADVAFDTVEELASRYAEFVKKFE